MRANKQNIHIVAESLDHAEGLNFGPDSRLYAGGEAGQVYRIDVNTGAVEHYATVEGFLLLGVTLDGNGNLYGCSVGRQEVVKVTPDGTVNSYSAGIAGRPLVSPNYTVFDSAGNLYLSDSGSYFEPDGLLYVIRPGGHVEVFHAGALSFPNGLAIDVDESYLYVVQSTGPNVVRLPLTGGDSSAEPELVAQLPDGVVPDGLAFDTAGRLIISCYKPDRIYVLDTRGELRVLMDDPWAELLNRPTNVALRDGQIYYANLGGWHIGRFAYDGEPMTLRYPRL